MEPSPSSTPRNHHASVLSSSSGANYPPSSPSLEHQENGDLVNVEGLLKHAHISRKTRDRGKNMFDLDDDDRKASEAEEAKLKAAEEEKDRLKEVNMGEDDRKKVLEQRGRVVSEVISTEQSYLKSMNTVRQCFVLPLLIRTSASSKSIIPVEHVPNLTNNLETLIQFHHTFLAELESPQCNIGALFNRYADLFLLYTTYLQGFESSLNAFNALKNHKKFQEFLVDCKNEMAKASGNVMDLQSYLIMPVQRVPRYVLLLQELKRYTPYSHPEYATLFDALQKIRKVAARINERKRDIENMQQLFNLSSLLTGEIPFQLILPHRRLIREGELVLTTSSGLFGSMKTSSKMVYLFSDYLMWTNLEHKYKGYMDLTAASLSGREKCIELATSKQSVVLECKDVQEMKEWSTDVNTVMVELQNERNKAAQRVRVQKSRARKTDHQAHDAIHEMITEKLASFPADKEKSEANAPGYDDTKIQAGGRTPTAAATHMSSPAERSLNGMSHSVSPSPSHSQSQSSSTSLPVSKSTTSIPTDRPSPSSGAHSRSHSQHPTAATPKSPTIQPVSDPPPPPQQQLPQQPSNSAPKVQTESKTPRTSGTVAATPSNAARSSTTATKEKEVKEAPKATPTSSPGQTPRGSAPDAPLARGQSNSMISTSPPIMQGEFRGTKDNPDAVIRVEFKGTYKPKFIERRRGASQAVEQANGNGEAEVGREKAMTRERK